MNQFGGGIGGPFEKNKIFFFTDFEAIRQVQDQTVIGFVPGAAVRLQTVSRSPALAPILNAYPLGNGPTTTSGVQQYTGVARSENNEYAAMIRLDDRFSSSTTGYLRFNYDHATATTPLGTLQDRQLNHAKPLNGAAELLHAFSPALINEFKFGINEVISHTYNLTSLPYTVNVSGFTALNSQLKSGWTDA